MVCLTGKWAGLDSVWEQKKINATLREMLENDGDQAREQSTVTTLIPGKQRMVSPIPGQERWVSHMSSAHCVYPQFVFMDLVLGL